MTFHDLGVQCFHHFAGLFLHVHGFRYLFMVFHGLHDLSLVLIFDKCVIIFHATIVMISHIFTGCHSFQEFHVFHRFPSCFIGRILHDVSLFFSTFH